MIETQRVTRTFNLALGLFFFLLLLGGCTKMSSSLSKDNQDVLLPMSQDLIHSSMDTGDVKAAMRAYFEDVKAPSFSQYTFVRKDLNGDYLNDALVYITTPYGRWCTDQGCTFLILRAYMQEFSVIGTFKGVRPPFYISSGVYNGWQDIAIESNGQLYKKAEIFLLRFDGREYKRLPEPPYAFSRSMIKASVFP